MTSNAKRLSVELTLLVIAIICTHTFQLQMLERNKVNEQLYKRFVPNSEFLKFFSLGFDRVIADFLWLSFVQYYGDRTAVVDERLRYAPDFIKGVVAMDPHFIRPYWFASFVFAGDLKLYKEAEEILDLGIRNNPQVWSLPYIAGFNQALYKHDYKKTAAYYRIAAKIPGAPSYLLGQSKIMDSNIPGQIKIIRTWEQMFRTGDSMVREKARDNLQVLWSNVYWEAPNEVIKTNAMKKLDFFEVKLLPKNRLAK